MFSFGPMKGLIKPVPTLLAEFGTSESIHAVSIPFWDKVCVIMEPASPCPTTRAFFTLKHDSFQLRECAFHVKLFL